MAELISTTLAISSTASEIQAGNIKGIISIDHIVYLWFGSFSGTSEELRSTGIPISPGELFPHIPEHGGIITVVSDEPTAMLHLIN